MRKRDRKRDRERDRERQRETERDRKKLYLKLEVLLVGIGDICQLDGLQRGNKEPQCARHLSVRLQLQTRQHDLDDLVENENGVAADGLNSRVYIYFPSGIRKIIFSLIPAVVFCPSIKKNLREYFCFWSVKLPMH